MKSRLLELPDWDPAVLNQLHVTAQRVEADSRRVLPGDVFLACRGEYTDGRDYIVDALQRGAAAVLWDDADGFAWNPDWQVPNLPVPNLRDQAGVVAAHVFGDPSHKMSVIGVTGTNGKTSISHWLAQAFTLLHRKAALIGTVGNGFYGELSETTHTTPAPVIVQQRLAEYYRQGAQVVSMEVSSHGLDQARVNGVHFHTAIFTNLTRDHFDYHHDLHTYGEVKRRLFHWQGLRYAVINADDAFGCDIAERVRAEGQTQVVTYGVGQGDVRAASLQATLDGLQLDVVTPWGQVSLKSQLLGHFNALNLLACLAALCVNEVPLTEAARVLGQIQPALGRMQRLGGGREPLVVVDYAHTPDALEKALSTLRDIIPSGSKLYCVFGCGGDRDRGKRPLMGETAERLADAAVVTSDNPRTEDPQAILRDILEGMQAPARVEADRAAAINWAIAQAKPGDIVLIAGKGHEEYQEINKVRHAFSDVQVADEALAKWDGKHADA